MDRLGSWDAARRVAVAVSGGADSLALAVLAQGWGDPACLIVDHGLRTESAEEAEAARAALAGRGLAARVLRLDGLPPGPGLAARARAARYAALSAACRAAGLVDLLLGHHAGDQAETVLMRRRRGSGPAGLAGMAALAETDDLRLLRPLLAVHPARLRAVVAAAGLRPAEDPSNADMRLTRPQLRREIGEDRAELLAAAAAAGAARAAAERLAAAELAERASLHPEGYAVLTPGALREDALAALLRSLSGRRLPVAGAAALAARPRPATLAGVRMMPAGRLGPGWLLAREAAAMAAAVPARPGRVWDGRFRVVRAPAGAWLGPLGAGRREGGLPAAVLRTLPALRGGGQLCCMPQLGYGSGAGEKPSVVSAAVPAAGAPFAACC